MKKLIILLVLSLVLILPLVSSQSLNDDVRAYYKLDKTSGDVKDELDNFNGTNLGATRGVQGLVNQSFDFNSGDWVNLTDSLNTDTFTASVWINPDNLGTSSDRTAIIAQDDSFVIGYRGSTDEILFIAGSSADTDDPVFTGVLSDHLSNGKWTHLAMSFNGTHSKAYINGTLMNQTTFQHEDNSNLIKLGERIQSGWATNLDADIDEVGIWKEALNDAQIKFLFENNATYPFSSGSAIDLNSPANNTITINKNITFNASLNAELIGSSYFSENSTLHIWHQNGTLYRTNSTVFSGTNKNETAIFNEKNIDFGDFKWNVLGTFSNSTNNISSFSPFNRTFSINRFEIIGESFSASTYDTDSQNFEINLSTDPSADLFSSSLIYNGTSYLADIEEIGSGNYTIRRNIDIPSLENTDNLEFFWDVTLQVDDDFSTQQTPTNQQTVIPSDFETSAGDGTINFTLLHEEDLEEAEAIFKADFVWYLGNGTVTKNESFELNKDNSFLFNSTPNNQTMFLSSKIELTNATTDINTSLSKRIYQFNKLPISQNTTQIDLLLPNKTSSRNVIIEIKDEGLIPLSDRLVKIDRFFPGLGSFKNVETRITDNFGQFSSKLVEDDVIYRFRFFDLDNNLLKTEDSITISCRSTICVLPFVIEDTDNVFGRFDNTEGFEYDFVFSDSTNITSFTWNDVTNDLSSVRLEVTRYSTNGSSIVCNVESTSATNTLICDVGSSRGSYVAEIFRTALSGNEIRIDSLSFEVSNPSSIFGLEGLMWSFILLMIMIGIGTFSPVAGIVLYLLGFIILGSVGIVYVHPALIVAQIILGVLFIWALR